MLSVDSTHLSTAEGIKHRNEKMDGNNNDYSAGCNRMKLKAKHVWTQCCQIGDELY